MRAVTWAVLLLCLALSAPAGAVTCDDVLARIDVQLADATCFHSDDLTTANPLTTPPNNPYTPPNLPGPYAPLGLPSGAFTPATDRGVISPDIPGDRTPITKKVPGIQLNARIPDDGTAKEARFLLRLPDDWNGDLVVAGASGTRSEFNGDFAWSDYVLQKGFAYASQNKGILNLSFSAFTVSPNVHVADPLACRIFVPAFGLWAWVHFYDNDPQKPFTEWQSRIVQAGRIAREGVKGGYDHYPAHTFAVGTSNGGYQVRRAMEEAPDLFDGGVDWEGTFVDSSGNNILATLPPAIANFPAYRASGFDPNSEAAQAIRAAGYPPDIVRNGLSLWSLYSAAFWEVTQCQWQKRLDPSYDTYEATPNFTGAGTYSYTDRAAAPGEVVTGNLDAFATTGKIKKPLITVAGTMDALLPIVHQARAYAERVAASRKGNNDARAAQYRLYEVQNGNHIENYKDFFPQLEYIQPHAQRAFDLLVDHVENNAPLPPDQCIPRGGSISGDPATSGRCAQLLKE